MITIYAISNGVDTAELQLDLNITVNTDYIVVYLKIVNAIHENKNLKVAVLNTLPAARWFETLAQKYGSNLVNFHIMTLRKLLEERIGIPINENIRDAELLDSGLLDVNIPASGQSDIYSYLLDIYLGEFLSKPNMILRTSEIVKGYHSDQWDEALKSKLIKRAYDRNLQRIKSGYSLKNNSAESQLIEWFEKSPQLYIGRLADLRLLQNYPSELGMREFGSVYKSLLDLNLDLRKIPINSHSHESVLREISVYINRNYSSIDNPDIDQLVDETSGLLKVELDAVSKLIRSGKVTVTEQLAKKIQRKFSGLEADPYALEILDEIENFVAVPPPSEPQDEWGEKEWIEWAVKEYLPYRFWLEDTNQINDEIGSFAGKYGDWLYSQYGKMLFNSDSMAWKAVLNLKDKIRSHDGPVLFVIIDNFNAKFFPFFQRELHHQGFHEQEVDYCLATLPTFTEIGKKSIITGHYSAFLGTDYALKLETTWKARLNKRILYIPNIHALREISHREHDVYFLNYLPIDITLHQHESHLGISHTRTVHGFLSALANDIRSFARNIDAEKNLLVVITSDHGSTRIPRGLINVLNNNFYKKHALDEHHRFITISDSECAKLSNDSHYDCYLFNRREYELPENYLVARKLARFLATDDSVYIHGGLTPEETIIPVALFSPVTVTPKPLIIKMVTPKEILIGARQTITFELTNPNLYPVERIQLDFLDRIIDGEFSDIEIVPKMDRVTASVEIRCHNQVDESTDSINIRVLFQFNDQEHETVENIKTQFKSLIKTKFNLNDL